MKGGSVATPESAWDWSAERLPEGTVGLRLCRIIGDDRLRLYEGMRWPDAASLAQFLKQQIIEPDAFGEGSYGVIDFLDADHNIIGDIGVDDGAVFQRLRRKLGCRVESTDGEQSRG